VALSRRMHCNLIADWVVEGGWWSVFGGRKSISYRALRIDGWNLGGQDISTASGVVRGWF